MYTCLILNFIVKKVEMTMFVLHLKASTIYLIIKIVVDAPVVTMIAS